MDSHGFSWIFVDLAWICVDWDAWICMDLHGFTWIWHGFGMDLDEFALLGSPLRLFWAVLGAFGSVWGRLGAFEGIWRSIGAKMACHTPRVAKLWMLNVVFLFFLISNTLESFLKVLNLFYVFDFCIPGVICFWCHINQTFS